MDPLPYDVTEAIIQCFGKCFWFKDPMKAFLRAAGVSQSLIGKYAAESKFPMARHILADLETSEEGRRIQRSLLSAWCKLRALPDKEVPNREAGLDALRNLKQLAVDHELVVRKQRESETDRARVADERAKLIHERAAKLAALSQNFNAAVMATDRQGAGYDLEEILAELFALAEIDYKRSYRTETQQIDGHFTFLGFDYLLEAKWRAKQPTEGDIGNFQRKVGTKLESTRGVFVSVPGYRPEVAAQFNGQGANIILMDGEHLTHVLEGRMDFKELLKNLIEAAAQRGVVYTRIS